MLRKTTINADYEGYMLKFLFGKELTEKMADKIPEVCGRMLAEKSISDNQSVLSATIQAKGAKEAAEITSNATRESAKAAIKAGQPHLN